MDQNKNVVGDYSGRDETGLTIIPASIGPRFGGLPLKVRDDLEPHAVLGEIDRGFVRVPFIVHPLYVATKAPPDKLFRSYEMAPA